jgi:hypothetical protein
MRELYHDFFTAHGEAEEIFLAYERHGLSVDKVSALRNNTLMPSASDASRTELPDRLCTWCNVLMKKRLVGGDQFIHYTCPKCIFQHTTRLKPGLQTPGR